MANVIRFDQGRRRPHNPLDERIVVIELPSLTNAAIITPKRYWIAASLLSLTLPVLSLAKYLTGESSIDQYYFSAIVGGVSMLIFSLGGYFGVVVPLREHRHAQQFQLSAWLIPAVVLLSAATCFHFTFSSLLWVYNCYDDNYSLRGVWPFVWPCFALLALSFGSLFLAIMRRREAAALLILTLACAAFAFIYDVSQSRYQVEVVMAHKDYWDNGGSQFIYYTWWWY